MTQISATPNQRRYVLAELAGAGSYMISMGHRVEGAVDAERLKAAFAEVVSRHDVLRTTFALTDGEVTASVGADPAFQFHHLEFADDLNTFRDKAVPLIFANVDPRKSGSLVRLVVAEAADHWRFTVAMHHAISDGFSRGVVNRELLKLYAGEELTEPTSYYDYVVPAQREDAPSRSAEAVVDDLAAPCVIPADGHHGSGQDMQGVFVERALDVDLKRLRESAKAWGASKFGFLGAVYGLALSGFTGQTTLASFFQSEGRKRLGAPLSVVGPFSETLALDLRFAPNQTFAEYATHTAASTREAVQHEGGALLDRILDSGKAPNFSLNMFPPISPIKAGDLEIGPREFLDRRTEYDLNLVWTEDRRVLSARAFYDAQKLSEARIDAFLDLVERLLALAIADPGLGCSDLLAQARQGRGIDFAIAETPPKTEDRPPLHALVEGIAAKRPDELAIISSQRELTYADLIKRAHAYANALERCHATAGKPVAILAERSPDIVAAMLGVSMFGTSFAVIDARYPKERIKHMLAVLGARHVIPVGMPPAIDLDQSDLKIVALNASDEHASFDAAPDLPQYDYHLFTSGTSGQPKLVSHTGDTLARFTKWQNETLSHIKDMRTVMVAGLSHDPIMRDIFLPLTTGGTLIVPTSQEMTDPASLRELLRMHDANALHLTPATGRLLSIGAEDSDMPHAVQAIFWGGDTLDAATLAKWRSHMPNARQFNLYGTTETPQAAVISELTAGEADVRRLPIGHPLPWMGLTVATNTGAPVGPGELGEIVVSLPHPVHGAHGSPDGNDGVASLVHHTGDLGFYLPKKGLYLVGRNDTQIKINAIRIDLAEIAATANRIAAVEDAAAILAGGDAPYISLFVVADSAAAIPSIRETLERELPDYMVPQRVTPVEKIPQTPNGKIDTVALGLLERVDTSEKSAAAGPAPETEAEREIAQIYARYTGQPVESVSLSLADIGADSLATIEVRLALEDVLNELPDAWEWRPVSELADIAARLSPRAQRDQRMVRMVRLDSFIVLRALAVIYILYQHGLTIYDFGGGSAALIVLAGFTFGRMQLPSILKDGRTGRIWALLLRILVPLVPISILIFGAHTMLGNNPHPSAILLYENLSDFITIIIRQSSDPRLQLVWLWFLHAYVQIFLIFAILLTFRGLREAAAKDPWRSAVVVFAITEIIGVGTVFGVTAAHGDIDVVSRLLRHAPTTLIPLLMLGVLFAFADTPQKRAIAVGLAGVHAVFMATNILWTSEYFIWFGALLIVVFLPYIQMPAILSRLIVAVSAHALMIYLSHRPLDFGLDLLFADGLAIFPTILLMLVVGIALGIAVRPILQWLGINRLAELRIST